MGLTTNDGVVGESFKLLLTKNPDAKAGVFVYWLRELDLTALSGTRPRGGALRRSP